MAQKRHVVVADHDASGHHDFYTKSFAAAFGLEGAEVTVLGPDPEGIVDAIRLRHGIQVSAITFAPTLLGPTSPIKRTQLALRLWSALKREIGQLPRPPDLVFLPYLDLYLARLTSALVNVKTPWSGLLFLPEGRNPERYRRLTPLHLHGALRRPDCRNIMVFDEFIAPMMRDALEKPVVPCPDFADEAAPDLEDSHIEELRDRAKGRPIVSLLGILTPRKGTIEFIQTALELEDVFFHAAGHLELASFDEESRLRLDEILQNRRSNLWIHPARIDREQVFNAVISTSRLVWAAYPGWPYSSNLLTKASVFHKPSIVYDNTLMADRVRRFGIGEVAVEGRQVTLVEAVSRAINRDYPSSGFEAFNRFHSFAGMREAVRAVLEAV